MIRTRRLQSKTMRLSQVLSVGLLLLTCSVGAAATPSPDRVLEIAEHLASKGQVGKAVNWAEQARVTPGASARVRSQAVSLQRRLRWRLIDAGYGVTELSVFPADSQVSIDERIFEPRRMRYRIWLPGGSHQLVVTRSNYAPYRSIITAKTDEVRSVTVNLANNLPPRLVFKTNPKNAEVWVSRRFMAFANRGPIEMPIGKSIVEVRAPGRLPWVGTLELIGGQQRTISIKLMTTAETYEVRRRHPDVKRRLTPLELANHGDRHNLGKRPLDGSQGRIFRGKNARSSAQESSAQDLPPASFGAQSRPSLASESAESVPAPMPAIETEPAAAVEASIEQVSYASTPMSAMTKGWIYSGIGLAFIAGGAAAAIYGANQALVANDLPLGHSQYQSYYGYASNLTFAGYGAAGIGVASLVVGGVYLFGDKGLSRRAMGWSLCTLGSITAAVGSWLVLDSVNLASQANALASNDYRYAGNYQSAQANWLAGVVALGAGGLSAALGVYFALNNSATRSAQSAVRPVQISLSPMVSRGRSGASLTMQW